MLPFNKVRRQIRTSGLGCLFFSSPFLSSSRLVSSSSSPSHPSPFLISITFSLCICPSGGEKSSFWSKRVQVLGALSRGWQDRKTVEINVFSSEQSGADANSVGVGVGMHRQCTTVHSVAALAIRCVSGWPPMPVPVGRVGSGMIYALVVIAG